MVIRLIFREAVFTSISVPVHDDIIEFDYIVSTPGLHFCKYNIMKWRDRLTVRTVSEAHKSAKNTANTLPVRFLEHC